MATQPRPNPTPPPAPPRPNPPTGPNPPPPGPKPEASTAARRNPQDEALPIGAKPHDAKDPQAVKFEPQAAPPRWDEPKKDASPHVEWNPEPSLDPRSEKIPAGVFVDGMDIATEQRLRSEKIEELSPNYPPDENAGAEPKKFDPHALAGGGAFVSPGPQKQVAGVTPPTKRE